MFSGLYNHYLETDAAQFENVPQMCAAIRVEKGKAMAVFVTGTSLALFTTKQRKCTTYDDGT